MSEEDSVRELFGEPIFEYTDEQAVADGVLIPFVVGNRDTRHRITGNAFRTLKEYYSARGYARYRDEQFGEFFLRELLPLVPEALHVYQHNVGGGVLKTDYDFSVTKKRDDVLWYIPNERNGVTIMLPGDY